MENQHKKTKHHVVPKSRVREGYNVHHPNNITHINQKTHDALHRLFDNKTPQEQLALWFSINRQVLSAEVSRKLKEVLEMDKEDFYKPRMNK